MITHKNQTNIKLLEQQSMEKTQGNNKNTQKNNKTNNKTNNKNKKENENLKLNVKNRFKINKFVIKIQTPSIDNTPMYVYDKTRQFAVYIKNEGKNIKNYQILQNIINKHGIFF